MTRDDIIKLARKAGIANYGLGWTCWEGQLERFAALVAAAEREACARVCESIAADHALHDSNISAGAAEDCAELIRARGQE